LITEAQGANILAYYTQGQGLISQRRNNASYFYHYDGLGSTKALTDANQNIQSSTIYDAWGNILSNTGSIQNVYLFRGKDGWYYEDGVNLIRARNFYSPATGQITRSLSRLNTSNSPPQVSGGSFIGPSPFDGQFWDYPKFEDSDLPPVPPPDPPAGRKGCYIIRDWSGIHFEKLDNSNYICRLTGTETISALMRHCYWECDLTCFGYLLKWRKRLWYCRPCEIAPLGSLAVTKSEYGMHVRLHMQFGFKTTIWRPSMAYDPEMECYLRAYPRIRCP